MAGNDFIKSMPNRPPAVTEEGGQLRLDVRDWNEFLIRLSEAVSKNQTVYPMSMTGNVAAVQNFVPLSSTDRGGSAGPKIVIAAHTCQHGGVLVSYGAGELTKDDAGTTLVYSVDVAGGDMQTYHVYVDNENYIDQATPAYKATTDAQKVVAGLHRYRVGRCVMVDDPNVVAVPTDPVPGGGGGSSGGGGDPIPGGPGVNPGFVIP